MKIKTFLFTLSLGVLAWANAPISVTVSGPSKIFTNDRVVYTATTVGVAPASYTWTVTGGSGVASGNTFTLTAPSAAATVSVSCRVVGSDDDPLSDENGKTVTVVVPQITVSRQSFKVSDFQNNVTLPGREIMDETGTAYLHRNGMKLISERLYLTISIYPLDVEVQQFELTTSNTSALWLYDRRDNDTITTPYIPEIQSGEGYMGNFSLLNYLSVEGKVCGEDYKVNLTINNNQKLSINYNVYGIENPAFRFPSPENPMTHIRALAPNLVDNEWGYVAGSANQEYDSIAYAVKSPPQINNIYFLVKDAVLTSYGLTPTNPVMPSSEGNGCETSMDTFGNNNGIFEDSDIDSFFTHSYWGNNTIATSISSSKILYYDDFHAARKSNRADGSYPAWNMFESKCGKKEVIIHRAEQIVGSIYGNIQKKYK